MSSSGKNWDLFTLANVAVKNCKNSFYNNVIKKYLLDKSLNKYTFYSQPLFSDYFILRILYAYFLCLAYS